MSTYNISFCGEIKKNINIFGLKKASYQELWTTLAILDTCPGVPIHIFFFFGKKSMLSGILKITVLVTL